MLLQCLTPGRSDRRKTLNQPDTVAVDDILQDELEVSDEQTDHECRMPESEKLEGLLCECLQLLQESVSILFCFKLHNFLFSYLLI